MIDAATFQAIAAVGGMILALLTLTGAWTYWLIRDLRSEMRRNHRELLALLGGHTHADGTPPVFHRLPDAAAG